MLTVVAGPSGRRRSRRRRWKVSRLSGTGLSGTVVTGTSSLAPQAAACPGSASGGVQAAVTGAREDPHRWARVGVDGPLAGRAKVLKEPVMGCAGKHGWEAP